MELKYCDTSKLVIQGKLKNNKTCKISLTVGKFYSSDHSIKKSSSTTLKLIDGQYPYGGNGIIEKEIKNIQITVGNKI
ncbi:MAG: hypothetical protein KDC52_14310, partial [Ignavibacteriae bacterium]|nr:hypothetical protein [Ignavibacteriota bacterium]